MADSHRVYYDFLIHIHYYYVHIVVDISIECVSSLTLG